VKLQAPLSAAPHAHAAPPRLALSRDLCDVDPAGAVTSVLLLLSSISTSDTDVDVDVDIDIDVRRGLGWKTDANRDSWNDLHNPETLISRSG
jgi:hypothetical protein